MRVKKILSSLFACALMVSVMPINTYGAGIDLPDIGDLNPPDLTAACQFTLKSDGTYEISGHEGFKDSVVSEGWVKLPSEYNGKKVTSIGDFVFCNSKYNNITGIVIPEGITAVGTKTFYGCEKLSVIEIPKSLTSFGESTFEETPWFNAQRAANPLVVVNNVLIDGKTAKGSVTIPNGVTNINKYAFVENENITSVSMPSSVKTIGNGAFKFCEALNNVVLSDNITSIGSNAFYHCALTEVKLPSGLKKIEKYTFWACNDLNKINIPQGVQEIDTGAFGCCLKLTSINIPNSVKKIGDIAFTETRKLDKITIPENVVSIGKRAFEYSGIKSVTVKNPKCTIFDDASTFSLSTEIWGYSNSTAQAYAKKYSRKFVNLGAVKGDANGDGVLRASDAAFIAGKLAEASIKGEKLTVEKYPNADFNGDGKITAADAAAIAKYLAEQSIKK